MNFDEFLEEWRDKSTPYIIARTSGSTGEPKTIHLDKEFVRQSALRTNRFFSIDKDSRLHSCVAADYIGGKMMAVRADMAGCRFTSETPSNRPLTEIGRDEAIDLLAVVPAQMVHILDNLRDMPKIRAVIIGGSAINPQLYRRICESGLNAYETYGMTETASHIALRKVGNEWFGCLDGIMVERDERGCLAICFDSGERFVTNDLAEVRDERHFKIRGRHDHMIITGGKKVNPYGVEEKLAPYIDSPFVITSEPDYKWGSAIVLIIEGNHDRHSDGDLMRIMKEILLPHEVAKKIERVERLPRTANGKIKR